MRTAVIIASLLCVALCIGGSKIGGWKKHNFDTSLNEVDQLALDAALTGVSAQANNDAAYVYKGVESCELQVLAGMRYRLTLNFQRESDDDVRQYEVIVYLVPWESKVSLESVRDVTGNSVSGDLSVNNALREQVLSFVDQQLRMRVNHDLSAFVLESYEVLSMQVVQGNVYELRVDFRNTQDAEAELVSYKVSVWSRPWLNPPLEITQIKDFVREAGTTQKQPPLTLAGTDTDYKWDNDGSTEKLVIEVLTKYALENVAEDFVMGSVKSAKVQVVSGMNLMITFDYESYGQQKSAEAKVWVQPWRDYASITFFREL